MNQKNNISSRLLTILNTSLLLIVIDKIKILYIFLIAIFLLSLYYISSLENNRYRNKIFDDFSNIDSQEKVINIIWFVIDLCLFIYLSYRILFK